MTDIDREVAEKVMGWDAETGPHMFGSWSPSTRIDHAWEVVEKLRERWTVVLDGRVGGRWSCAIEEDHSFKVVAFHKIEDAPLAICKAALAAMEKS